MHQRSVWASTGRIGMDGIEKKTLEYGKTQTHTNLPKYNFAGVTFAGAANNAIAAVGTTAAHVLKLRT